MSDEEQIDRWADDGGMVKEMALDMWAEAMRRYMEQQEGAR